MLLVGDVAELYTRYHRQVYAFLLRLTGSPEAAEELLQETFYRAVRGAATYRGDSPPATWLCAIARRLYAEQVRRWSRERQHRSDTDLTLVADTGAGPEDAADQMVLRGRIDAVLQELPETQRLALLLRDADGLPYESVAEMLGLSLANAKVTIHRARLRFRTLYAIAEGVNES